MVERGDTLSGIAERCNTTVEALLAANPDVTDPTRLSVGATLIMPATVGMIGGDDDNRVVIVEGTVTGPSPEDGRCQTLRGVGGELYALLGTWRDLRPGDRVLLTGEVVSSTDCEAGTPVRVERIE